MRCRCKLPVPAGAGGPECRALRVRLIPAPGVRLDHDAHGRTRDDPGESRADSDSDMTQYDSELHGDLPLSGPGAGHRGTVARAARAAAGHASRWQFPATEHGPTAAEPPTGIR